MKNPKIPKYKVLGVIIVAIILYSIMMSPVFMVYTIKSYPSLSKAFHLNNDSIIYLDSLEKQLNKQYDSTVNNISDFHNKIDSIKKVPDSCIEKQLEIYLDSLYNDNKNQDNELNITFDRNSNKYFENPFEIYAKFAFFALIFILLINCPIKKFFSKKRKNLEPSQKIINYTRKFIHKTPFINSILLMTAYVLMHLFMIYNLNSVKIEDINFADKKLYTDFLIMSAVSSFLVVLFVYIWQKFRVNTKYLEIIYTRDELKKRLPNLPKERISKRLILSSLMTTFLPLLMVCFYVFTSISKIKDLNLSVLTPEVNQIFLGEFSKIINVGSALYNFFYINSVDTFLMIYGIIVGSFVTLIYIAFFVKLTASSIVNPIKELVNNMKSFEKKGISNSTIVRTNDEIGILGEEFNNMSDKINNYITEINTMNQELEQKVIDRTSEIMKQKEEIETQRDEIEAQRDEIEKQRDYVIEQRDRISIQNKHITDSIEYAKRIQTAVLMPSEEISKILENHFIFYRPRNIVSGDFYWVEETVDVKIVVVADCTGHGVPGAFMSMLGLALLKEIIHKKDCDTPAFALNELRNQIKIFLRQTGKDNENKDGMDIAMCVIEKSTQNLQFAGANNPAFVIRKVETKYELIDLKPNKMPIGIYIGEEKQFETRTLQLQENDTIYMFSDGYIDQFGGETGRKFLMRNFKELLLSIQEKDIPEQKDILVETFDNWKAGIYEQVDDVLVMGFKNQTRKKVNNLL